MVRSSFDRGGRMSFKSSGIRKPPHDQSLLTKPWLAQEDQIVLDLRIIGWGWMAISKKLQGRSWAACRSRFHNHLIKPYKWAGNKKDDFDQSYQRLEPDMWSKVAEQMAAPWKVAEAVHWQRERQEVVRPAANSAFRKGELSRDGKKNVAAQANRLPKLRMPIERDTIQLPSFDEMFSDVPCNRSTST